MLRHAIAFFVIAIYYTETLYIDSDLQLNDIRKLLENLQQERKYNKEKDDQSDRLDENNSYEAITSRDLEALINQAPNDVYQQNRNEKEFYLKNLSPSKHNENSKKLQQQNLIKEVLMNLNKQNPLALRSQDIIFDDDDSSKVVIIFNPRKDLNQNDVQIIDDVLWEMLPESATKKKVSKPVTKKKKKKKKSRWVRLLSSSRRFGRRRNRESKELYSSKESIENFKPKRGRSDYGGGRTPIPYIRHRNIYERDL